MRSRSLPLVALLLVAWAALTFRIGGPWVGHQDGNGAWISAALRNYANHGFVSLGGVPALDTTPEFAGETPRYYTSHPPLAVWMAYPLVALAGYHEALVRVVYAGCTLLSAAALVALVRRLIPGGEIWALALYLLTPMMLYFGRMPDHEAPALLLVLLLSVVLVDWIRRPSWLRLGTAGALMAALALTAWGGLICGLALCVALWVAYPARWRALAALALAGVAAAGGVVAYYQAVWPGALADLLARFAWRTSSASLLEGSQPFTLMDFVARAATRLLTLYTPSVMVLAALGAARMRRWNRLQVAITTGLLAGALAFVVLFRNAAYIHDYYLLYAAPPLSVLGAAMIAQVRSRRRPRLRFAHALTTALLIWLPVSTAIYLAALHAGGTDSTPLATSAVLREYTTPADRIVSNRLDTGLAVEFYAFRRVEWGVNVSAALSAARASGSRLVVLACGTAEEVQALALADMIEVIPRCWIGRSA